MSEYAICKWFSRGLKRITLPDDGTWGLPIPISPEQAALGAMTLGEVASILVRRVLYQQAYDDPKIIERCEKSRDKHEVQEAKALGLWPPEVTA